MNSYVAVMTHPYFAVTGTDGAFEIDGIADGTYDVEAWHERLGTQTGKVTVSGGSGSVDFSFSPRRKTRVLGALSTFIRPAPPALTPGA